MDSEGNWLGVGLYTAAEGARLLDLPAARVRRWLDGYRTAGREHRRLWRPQLPKFDDRIGLGFLDLMQLRLVHRIVTRTDISVQAAGMSDAPGGAAVEAGHACRAGAAG